MRYSILNSKVVDSILLDAPYDTKQDAVDALNAGTKHNCPHCYGEPLTCKQRNISIESCRPYGPQRIEVKLSNGQALTLMVDSDTGKLSILSDTPHMVAEHAEVVQNDGYCKGNAMPQYIVSVECYGYPSD
jgi:hypothetical protein